jgi:hypothetical protein
MIRHQFLVVAFWPCRHAEFKGCPLQVVLEVSGHVMVSVMFRRGHYLK